MNTNECAIHRSILVAVCCCSVLLQCVVAVCCCSISLVSSYIYVRISRIVCTQINVRYIYIMNVWGGFG